MDLNPDSQFLASFSCHSLQVLYTTVHSSTEPSPAPATVYP